MIVTAVLSCDMIIVAFMYTITMMIMLLMTMTTTTMIMLMTRRMKRMGENILDGDVILFDDI